MVTTSPSTHHFSSFSCFRVGSCRPICSAAAHTTSLTQGVSNDQIREKDGNLNIDIVINRGVLGFDGDNAPEAAPSKKQTKKRLSVGGLCTYYLNSRRRTIFYTLRSLKFYVAYFFANEEVCNVDIILVLCPTGYSRQAKRMPDAITVMMPRYTRLQRSISSAVEIHCCRLAPSRNCSGENRLF